VSLRIIHPHIVDSALLFSKPMNQYERSNYGVKSFKLFDLASKIFPTYRSQFDDMLEEYIPKECSKSEDASLGGEDLSQIMIYSDQVTKIPGSCPYKAHDSVSDARVCLLCVLDMVLIFNQRGIGSGEAFSYASRNLPVIVTKKRSSTSRR